MPNFGTSSYSEDGTPDTQTSLSIGSYITTTLASDINDSETESIELNDAGRAPVRGFISIENEIIYYEGRYGSNLLKELERGANSTTPAAHTAGATVLILPPPFYINPALIDAIISLQENLNSLTTRVETLEGA